MVSISIDNIVQENTGTGIAATTGQSELYKRRELAEVVAIRRNKKPIYGASSFRRIQDANPDIFPDMPDWTYAQLITHALRGRETPPKNKVQKYFELLSRTDREIADYIKDAREKIFDLEEQQRERNLPEIPQELKYDFELSVERIANFSGLSPETIYRMINGGIEARPIGTGRYSLDLGNFIHFLEGAHYPTEAGRLYRQYRSLTSYQRRSHHNKKR